MSPCLRGFIFIPAEGRIELNHGDTEARIIFFSSKKTNFGFLTILTTFKYNIELMSQYYLGEFEEVVLLTVAILDEDAYGVSIIEEIEKRMDRKVSIGAVQTVLRRLENKGMLQSEFGEATKVRGGKRKRYFYITKYGRQVLEEAKDQRMALWKAIPAIRYK